MLKSCVSIDKVFPSECGQNNYRFEMIVTYKTRFYELVLGEICSCFEKMHPFLQQYGETV